MERNPASRPGSTFSRRQFLGSAGAVTLGAVAGCLGSSGDPNTYLGPPDTPGDPEDFAYPAYGQRVPDVAVQAPLHGRRVSPRDFDETVVMTFFYSYCQSVCPRLISALRNVQTAASESGYEDDVAFLPVTFDPARDTAPRFEEYADAMRIDLDAGNWYFLRPDGAERAEAVVTDTFGLAFEQTDPNGEDPGYMFTHMALILVVNPDGYVERAYPDPNPVWQDIEADVRTVVNEATEG